MRRAAFAAVFCLLALWPSPARAQQAGPSHWLQIPALTAGWDTLSHVNGGGELVWARQRTSGLSFDAAGDVGFNGDARFAFGVGHGVPFLGSTADHVFPKLTAEVHGVVEAGSAQSTDNFRGGVGVGAGFHVYELCRVIGDYVKDGGRWHWRVGVVLVLPLIDE